jgi:hypothetical protein
VNEEALARWGLLHKKKLLIYRESFFGVLSKHFISIEFLSSTVMMTENTEELASNK